jgi:hypothetical protein
MWGAYLFGMVRQEFRDMDDKTYRLISRPSEEK